MVLAVCTQHLDGCNVLQVFDAAHHAHPIARAAYPYIIRTKLSDMRLGSV